MNDRITHDISWATAVALADTIDWHREEDYEDALKMFYAGITAAIKQWQTLVAEENKRLFRAATTPEEN